MSSLAPLGTVYVILWCPMAPYVVLWCPLVIYDPHASLGLAMLPILSSGYLCFLRHPLGLYGSHDSSGLSMGSMGPMLSMKSMGSLVFLFILWVAWPSCAASRLGDACSAFSSAVGVVEMCVVYQQLQSTRLLPCVPLCARLVLCVGTGVSTQTERPARPA